jgi:DNA adenine methylase
LNSKFINDNIVREFSKKNYDTAKDKKDVISLLQTIKMTYGATQGFNSARTGHKIETDFTKYKDKLSNTIILNQDYRIVLKKYDSPKTFFYLDPPYEHAKENHLYKHLKEFITPQEIYDSLKGIKGKFLLSYNDSPLIRKIFSEYTIKKIKVFYSIKKKYTTELLIYN